MLSALLMCPKARPDEAARIHFMIGNVDVFSGERQIKPAVGGLLGKNDSVATAEKSSCDLLFADSMLIRLGEKTKAVVGTLRSEVDESLRLSKGSMMVIFTRLGKESAMRLKGSTVTIAVRGTVFVLYSDEKRTGVSVLDGAVEMEIGGDDVSRKKIAVSSGNFAEITTDAVADILSGKASPSLRKLTEAEKTILINELVIIRRESVGQLPGGMRSSFDTEIEKVLAAESVEQKKRREAEAKAVLKKAEEARKKAELEALKKKQEEAERLKKEAEEAERKKIEATRKAAAEASQKKQTKTEKKSDRSSDTSGN